MCYMYYTCNMQAQYRIANQHTIKINSKRNKKKYNKRLSTKVHICFVFSKVWTKMQVS